MARTVLVVNEDATWVADVIAQLQGAGYNALGAYTFARAVQMLDSARPAFLVTTLQLGAFNGLHLLLRGRSDDPRLKAIVIGPPDPLLERDAHALGATRYLVRPTAPRDVVGEILKMPTDPASDDEPPSAARLLPAARWASA